MTSQNSLKVSRTRVEQEVGRFCFEAAILHGYEVL